MDLYVSIYVYLYVLYVCIHFIYIYIWNLWEWHIGCGLDILTVSHNENMKNSVTVHPTKLNVSPDPICYWSSKGFLELLIFSVIESQRRRWKTSEGMPQKQSRWTCQREWGQTGKSKSFLLSHPFMWVVMRRYVLD